MYLSKADRRRIAEIIEIFADELIDLMAHRVATLANSKEDEASRMDGCHRKTNEWLWELGRILMMPIKQGGRKETHIESRATPEEASEEDDEATGS